MKALSQIAFYTSLSLAVALGVAGCKNNANNAADNPANPQDQTQTADQSQDPANANVAPVSNASDNTGAPSGAYPSDQDSSNSSPQAPRSPSTEDRYADDSSSGSSYGDNSDSYQPVEYASQPPPQLPQYDQPPCPGDGYIWTPG